MDKERYDEDILALTAALLGVHKALHVLATENPPKLHEEFYAGMRTITSRLEGVINRLSADREQVK